MAWIRSHPAPQRRASDARRARGAAGRSLGHALRGDRRDAEAEQGRRRPSSQFKPADLFRHTVVHYDLAEAIRDGIVKKPILERVEVQEREDRRARAARSTRRPAQRLGEVPATCSSTGIERWKKVETSSRDEGDERKPILFILCNDRNEAREVANYLTLRRGRRARTSSGRRRHGLPRARRTSEPLFVEHGRGRRRPLDRGRDPHRRRRRSRNEAEWEKVRQAVNAIDHDEIPDPDGSRCDDDGQPGHGAEPVQRRRQRDDAQGGLGRPQRQGHRPAAAVRLAHADRADARPRPAQDAPADPRRRRRRDACRRRSCTSSSIRRSRRSSTRSDDIIEAKASDEIEHAREYVPILQKADLTEREARGRAPGAFRGAARRSCPTGASHSTSASFPALAPGCRGMDEIADTEIQTYLQEALAVGRDRRGRRSRSRETPSYRDFDHVIEVAYAVPLLRELRDELSAQDRGQGRGARSSWSARPSLFPAGIPLSLRRA